MSKVERADTYFIDGRPYMVGVDQTEAFLDGDGSPVPIPPPGNGGGSAFAYTPVLWKEKSTSEHPDIGNGDLTGRYQRIGDKGVYLQISIKMGSTTHYGPGKQYWYLQPPNLMPDLVGNALRAVGSAQAYVKQSESHPGTIRWSETGGVLKWGLRCSFPGANVGFSRNNPGTWKAGDTLLAAIYYELP